MSDRERMELALEAAWLLITHLARREDEADPGEYQRLNKIATDLYDEAMR